MIEVCDVSLRFGATAAVDAVSLRVEPGAAVGIEGPSGCGKTTLLRLIAGLALPDAGTVRIDGKIVSTPASAVEPSRRGIGMVFQRPALWPHMTVAENIGFGLRGVGRAAAGARTDALLDAVGLAGFGARRPHELSVGQARRVALARALAPEPRHLLMDEPLVNLEPELRAGLVELVRAQAERTGACLLYVTHLRDELERLGARILRMRDGRLELGIPEGEAVRP